MPADPLVTLLAEALHEANIECDYSRKFDQKSCRPHDGPHSTAAVRAVAAIPEAKREALLMGLAWAEVEAALDGERGLWLIQGVQLVDTSDSEDLDDQRLEWEAEAVDYRRGAQPTNVTALGHTPTAALEALTAALREREASRG